MSPRTLNDFYCKKKAEKGEKPNSAYLNIGFKCVNRCIFCAVADISYVEMNTKTAKMAIAYCSKVGCKRLTLSGGEPTVRKDFLLLADYARSLNLELLLQTNARIFNDAEFCRKTIELGVTDFYVSLHGSTRQIHDTLTRTKGSYDETVQGIRNLLLLGARVDTNFVITMQNLSDIPKYAEQIVHDFDEIGNLYFTFPTPVGNAYRFASEIFPKFSNVRVALVETVDFLRRSHKNFSIVDVPLCVFDSRSSTKFIHRPMTPYDLYIEPKNARWAAPDETGKHVYSSVCKACNPEAKKRCSCVYQTYLRLYGNEGLKPIK